MSETPLLNPLMSAPITITTITPMATPRMVSAARTLCARSDPSAIPTPSKSGVIWLLLPQGGDRVEPRRPCRGVHAGHDPDRHAEHDAEDDGDRGHAGRERRGGVEEHRQRDPRADAER